MALALLFTRWGGDASSDLLRRIGFDVLREATAGFAEPGDHEVALTASVAQARALCVAHVAALPACRAKLCRVWPSIREPDDAQ
jgi:hypothetical protein